MKKFNFISPPKNQKPSCFSKQDVFSLQISEQLSPQRIWRLDIKKMRGLNGVEGFFVEF